MGQRVNITFKGKLVKLKNVPHTISVEWLIFTIVFDVSQLSNKPSNFARANKPYAMGLRVKWSRATGSGHLGAKKVEAPSKSRDFYDKPLAMAQVMDFSSRKTFSLSSI